MRTLSSLSEVAGINRETIRTRISNGWDIERAVTAPVVVRGSNKRKRKGSKTDITGQQFGYLRAIKFVRFTEHTQKQAEIWLFECVCGNKAEIVRRYVTQRKVKSCGCVSGRMHVSSGGLFPGFKKKRVASKGSGGYRETLTFEYRGQMLTLKELSEQHSPGIIPETILGRIRAG